MKESTIEWFKQNLPHVKENQIYMQEVDEMGGEIFKVFTVQCLGRGIFFEDVPYVFRKPQVSYVAQY